MMPSRENNKDPKDGFRVTEGASRRRMIRAGGTSRLHVVTEKNIAPRAFRVNDGCSVGLEANGRYEAAEWGPQTTRAFPGNPIEILNPGKG